MKRYLVQFNRPLLLKIIDDGREEYETVYGFFGGFYTDDEEYSETQYHHKLYSSYLAAVHEWSNSSSPEFDISEIDALWTDQTGHKHGADDWFHNICKRAMERLGLDFTTYVLDLDKVSGPADGLIKTASYMDYLVSKAVSPKE